MNTSLSDLGFTPTAPATAGTAPVAPTASAGGSLGDLGFKPSGGAPQASVGAPAGAATGNEGPIEAVGNVLKNFIPNIIPTAVGFVKAPLQGLADLTKIPGEVAGLWKGNQVVQPQGTLNGVTYPGGTTTQGGGLGAFFPNKSPLDRTPGNSAFEQLPSTASNMLVPSALRNTLEAAGTFVASGGTADVTPQLRAASAAIQNNPVGEIAPLVLVGQGIARGISPEVGAAYDAGISKFGNPYGATDAVLGAARKTAGAVADFADRIVRYGVKGLTGLDAPTIKAIIENPDQYSADNLANTTRINVAQLVKDALDAKEATLGESGKQYTPIKASETPITLSPFDLKEEIRSKLGLGYDKATDQFQRTTSGAVLSPGDVSKVNSFYKLWQPRFDAGTMAPREYLNMRSELANLSHYEGIGKSEPLEAGASRMRGSFNTKYRSQVSGLEDLDAEQYAMRTELKNLGNGLLDKNGDLRDSDINKIAKATGKAKNVLLTKLEELVPGITERLNALKAAEDIRDVTERHKVGTYKQLLPGGIATVGAATGNIMMLVGGITEAIITNPSVAVPLLRAYGFSKALVAGVMANLATIASAANQLPNGTGASFGALSPTLQKGVGMAQDYMAKNPVSLGLSLKDVTKDNAGNPIAGKFDANKFLEADTTTVPNKYIPDDAPLSEFKPQAFVDIRKLVPSEYNDIKEIGTPASGVTDWQASKAHINDLASRYAAGETPIPIRVRITSDQYGKFYEVTDGHHRIAAMEASGIKEAPVIFDKYTVDKYGGGSPKSLGTLAPKTAEVYQGEKNLTLDTLEQLKGRATVSKQFIEDLTNRGNIKQFERDTIRKALADEGNTVNVKDFANKVRTELLPLKARSSAPELSSANTDGAVFNRREINEMYGSGVMAPQYENISLPEDIRGPVANYQERIYQSPIKTSAGDVHFDASQNPGYFAHTRIEDMGKGNVGDAVQTMKTKSGGAYEVSRALPDQKGIRRVIEVQSDLFQKGRLENESFALSKDAENYKVGDTVTKRGVDFVITKKTADGQYLAVNAEKLGDYASYLDNPERATNKQLISAMREQGRSDLERPYTTGVTAESRLNDLAKLEPYRNTWHERIIREEVKQAAKDGKTALQFPTGETAMKIEGLGDRSDWRVGAGAQDNTGRNRFYIGTTDQPRLTPDQLKIGSEVNNGGSESWIITDVLGDGKFKAVPKNYVDYGNGQKPSTMSVEKGTIPEHLKETFDISGKVDTSNPIYQFYQKTIGKYLINHYGAQQVTDPQGVKWLEVPIKKEYKKLPITAMGRETRSLA